MIDLMNPESTGLILQIGRNTVDPLPPNQDPSDKHRRPLDRGSSGDQQGCTYIPNISLPLSSALTCDNADECGNQTSSTQMKLQTALHPLAVTSTVTPSRSRTVEGNRQRTSFVDATPRRRVSNAGPFPSKYLRRLRRKDISRKFGTVRRSADGTLELDGSDTVEFGWQMVIDPSGRLAHWWSSIVSLSFLYNFWVVISRFEFGEIRPETVAIWFTLDYTADALYLLDIVVHLRTGYMEDGVLQTDRAKLRAHYMSSSQFYVDCLCLVPLDFLYLTMGFNSLLRVGRLLKFYRYMAFLDHTERHTNFPNVVRTLALLHRIFAIFHWNACVLSAVTRRLQAAETGWTSAGNDTNPQVCSCYLQALYRSTLMLTMTGTYMGEPRSRPGYAFVIAELIFGLLLFANILGNVANIVTSVSAARKDFQGWNLSICNRNRIVDRNPKISTAPPKSLVA